MSDKRRAYLAELDIQPYQRRRAKPSTIVPAAPAPPPPPSLRPKAAPPAELTANTADVASMDWAALRRAVASCTLCGLCKTRTKTVFGVGDENADWMFVGEAPGADEDQKGEPFVGRAGQLLTSMIQALGFRREQVFIANILRCRPPNNREPTPEEAALCAPYLERTIALVKPKIIIAVGRIAAQNLLHTEETIGKMRGRLYHYGTDRIPVVVTYHPAYLLRSPGEKRKSWTDLKYAREVAGGHVK